MSSLWRMAYLTGSIDPEEVPMLDEDSIPKINGQCDWVAPEMNVLGTMHGDLQELASGFGWMVALAPSFTAAVHLSPIFYPDEGVENTIMIVNGLVTIGPPRLDQLRPESDAERAARFANAWETSPDMIRWSKSRPS